MTYNVFGGTLSLTQSITTVLPCNRVEFAKRQLIIRRRSQDQDQNRASKTKTKNSVTAVVADVSV